MQNFFVKFFIIAISLLCVINLSACAEIKEFFASSTSYTSLGSASASLGSASASSASSDSSNSISGSVDSTFKSSSKSLTGDNQYVNDIADLTYAYVNYAALQNSYKSFQNEISEIARRHGIISWENNTKTYIAFGKGLKKAKLTGAHYETIKQLLGDSNYSKMQDIQKGYNMN